MNLAHPSTFAENPGFFLAIRRGLPFTLAVLLLFLALLLPAVRGWCLFGAVACLAEVSPSFRSGASYLRTRSAITRWDAVWVRALRPLFRSLGLEDSWLLSFCVWNNHRIRNAFASRRAQRALVLLPHCIQLARCKATVTEDLAHCSRCGRCVVETVLEETLAKRWDVVLSNRSAKAYRAARAFCPDLIVAVACSDRLVKGIVKLPEIPSYVIPLAMPHGMCVDTSFDMAHLLETMETLVEPRMTVDPKIVPLQKNATA